MKKSIFILLILAFCNSSFAQVGINTDGSQPDSSAILDAKSTTKGFLPPRMNTTQRNAVTNPAEGLTIYNTDCEDLQVFNGTAWIPMGNSGSVSAPSAISGPTTPCINAVGVTYSISPVSGAVGYNWIVPVGSTITGGQGTTTITVTFGNTSGAIFVSAYGTCWKSLGAHLGVQLQPLPATPVAGVHVPSQTQIVWNWNAVQGATGYKFNTVNDYSTATDMGTATSTTETGLTCNTSYTRYIWSYNSCGISNVTTLNHSTDGCPWSCGQYFTDPRNGKNYGSIQIGSQCWMKSNLNIGLLINGTINQTNQGIIEKYCYNNLETNCDIYGGLYQWDELLNYESASNLVPSGRQGICPSGWHVPSVEEFLVMINLNGGTNIAGGSMKETGTVHWLSPNSGATNSSGLTALGAGYLNGTGINYTFNSLLWSTGFWTTSELTLIKGTRIALAFNGVSSNPTNDLKTYGYSCRCVKD